MNRSCLALLASLLAPVAFAQEAGKVNPEKEVEALVKRLRTESLRKAAREKGKELASDETVEAAILFFYDLRARDVLLAALASDDSGVETTISYYCMDAFELEDLPRLFAIVSAKLPSTEADVDQLELRSILGGREDFVKRVTTRMASLLGVEPPEFPFLARECIPTSLVTTQERLRLWWLKMLRQAKAKEGKSPRLDALLAAVEKAGR